MMNPLSKKTVDSITYTRSITDTAPIQSTTEPATLNLNTLPAVDRGLTGQPSTNERSFSILSMPSSTTLELPPSATLATTPNRPPTVTGRPSLPLTPAPPAKIIRVRNHDQICNTQILIALDLSTSMTNSIGHYNEFFTKGFPKIINNHKPNLNNQAFLMGFAGKTVYPPQPFYTTREIERQVENLRNLIANGTPLFMAIEKGLEHLHNIKRPDMAQQLHIHTDGSDTIYPVGGKFLVKNQRWEKPEHRLELIRVRSATKEKMRTFLRQNLQNKICFYSYINDPHSRKTPEHYFNKYGEPTLDALKEEFPSQVFIKTTQEMPQSAPTTSTETTMGDTAESLTRQTLEAMQSPIYYQICHLTPDTPPDLTSPTWAIPKWALYGAPRSVISLISSWDLTLENYQKISIQLNKRELPNEEKLALIQATAEGNRAEIIDIIERNAP